jgi:hypothetical protein
MLATFERPLSPSLTFPTARANVKFRSRPVAPQENPRRLLRVGSDPLDLEAAVVRSDSDDV